MAKDDENVAFQGDAGRRGSRALVENDAEGVAILIAGQPYPLRVALASRPMHDPKMERVRA